MTPELGSVSGAGGRMVLERRRALQAIERAADQAARGRSRVVVVSGPSGSGRSALLDEVCDALGPGWVVRSTAGGTDDGERRPAAVLLDDADDLPGAAVTELAAAVTTGAVALAVLAVRAGHRHAGVDALVRTPGTLVVDLAPLTPAAVATLCAAAGHPSAAVAVHRRTAGLPALVAALLDDPGCALPPAAVRHVRRAVAAAGTEVRSLVEVLAVAPGPVPADVAERAAGAAAVGRARDADLVRDVDGSLAVTAPLLAEVVCADLSASARAARRRDLARSWMLADDPCPASVARLLADAGDHLAARSFFVRAAEAALHRDDPGEAVRHYLEAQRHGSDLGPDHLERAACAAASVGRPGLAERWAQRAETHLRADGRDAAAQRVWQHPELAYVRRTATRGELPTGTPGRLAAEAESTARRGDPDAGALAALALAEAVAADDLDAAGTAAVALLLAGRPDESRGVHDELRDRAIRDRDHPAEAAQLRALSRVALAVGDPLAALLHARAAVAAAERGAGPVPGAFQRIHLGAVLTLTGDLDEAASIVGPLVEDPDPTVAAIAAIPLAGIDLGRGRPARALERLAPLLPHREAAGPDAFSGVLLQVAEAHVQQGDHDRARDVLADLDAWVGGRLEPTRPDRLALAGRIAHREGDHAALVELAAVARDLTEHPGPAVVAVAELLHGLSLRGGDDAAAAGHLRAAAVAAVRAPRAGLAVTAWLDAGAAWLAAGRRDEACEALDEAKRLAGARGIGAEDERIAALDAALHHGLPDVHLTPRERSLLGLLTEGCTNRRMAERLHLSEKTVRNQLSTLFAKLGIERRSQAAVLAVQLGIEPPSDC